MIATLLIVNPTCPSPTPLFRGADGEINLASIIHLVCLVWRRGLKTFFIKRGTCGLGWGSTPYGCSICPTSNFSCSVIVSHCRPPKGSLAFI